MASAGSAAVTHQSATDGGPVEDAVAILRLTNLGRDPSVDWIGGVLETVSFYNEQRDTLVPRCPQHESRSVVVTINRLFRF